MDVKKGAVIVGLSGKEQQLAAVKAAEFELLSAQQALDTLIENAENDRAEAQLRLQKPMTPSMKLRNAAVGKNIASVMISRYRLHRQT